MMQAKHWRVAAKWVELTSVFGVLSSPKRRQRMNAAWTSCVLALDFFGRGHLLLASQPVRVAGWLAG